VILASCLPEHSILGVGGSAIRLEDARYSFGQLRDFHDRLAQLGVLRNVVLTDIDEVRNSVRIGVRSLAESVQVATALASSGVPEDGVLLQVRLVQPVEWLSDRFRPVPGAVQIETVYSRCSLGVNAISDLGQGFVTASHCSIQPFGGSPDYGNFYQNTFSSQNFIGFEMADPPLLAPGPAPCNVATVGCRYSDANFVLYNFSSDAQQGTIARTLNSSPVCCWSLKIDPNSPRFLISDAAYSPFVVGQAVNRMGRTTGWRTGVVTATCVHYHNWVIAGVSLLCQAETSAPADGGDSAGPAFDWDGYSSSVVVTGITVARIVQNGEIVGSGLSQWMYIEF
jgi:hypothetical protein